MNDLHVFAMAMLLTMSATAGAQSGRITVDIPPLPSGQPGYIGIETYVVQAGPVEVSFAGAYRAYADPPLGRMQTSNGCVNPPGSYPCRQSPGMYVYFSRPVKNLRMLLRSFPYGVWVNATPFNTYQYGPWPRDLRNFSYAPVTTAIYVDFSEPITFWGWMVDISVISFELADASGQLSLELSSASDENHRRILTHKYRSDDEYPSPWQQADGHLEIVGHVRDSSGTPLAGKTAYFRVRDPADTAPYVVAAGDAHDNDNFDTRSTAGTLTRTSAVSDSTGRVSTTLISTTYASGDNYLVEASLSPELATNPNFACAATCASTGVITAWKRVYVEYDRMFARGAFITEDVPAAATQIYVSDLSRFQTGDTVRLIHAPNRFSIAGPPLSADDPRFHFYSEDHLIRVQPQPIVLQDGTILPPHLALIHPDGTPDLTHHAYGGDPGLPGVIYLSDAVGIVSQTPATSSLDVSLVAPAFADAFVDIAALPQTIEEIPYLERVNDVEAAHLSKKWADASVRRYLGSASYSKSNHQYVVAGSRYHMDPSAPNGQPGALFGQTPIVMSGFSRSWIWLTRIANAVAEPAQPVFGLDPAAAAREVVVHEMTHQWHANQTTTASTNIGHCLYGRYQNDGGYCLMHMPFHQPAHNAEWADDQVSLHYQPVANTGVVDSEYLTMRRAPEPVPTP